MRGFAFKPQIFERRLPMTEERLSSHEVFQFLQPEQVHSISDTAEEISLKSGDVVYQQGEKAEYLYTLLSGQVALRLMHEEGVSLLIEDLTEGALFGSCVCFDLDEYTLSARCTVDSKLLRIHAPTLKKLLEKDLTMGYALQTRISRTYFKRYIEAMRKLQAIIHAMPLQAY
jgi:CRP-like cAMP-binding protein